MICDTCKLDKPEAEFSFKKKATGERNRRCKVCQRAYFKEYWKTHGKDQMARIVRNKVAQRKVLRQYRDEYYSHHPCVDCGSTKILGFQFDHRVLSPDNVPISRLIRMAVSLERMKREIEKCDVRCGGCHQIRHTSIPSRNT